MNARKILLQAALLMVVLMTFGCKDDNTITTAAGQQYEQRDREGIPAINTALIPAASKDAFNQGEPKTDAATFRATAQTTIEGLRAAVNAVPGFPPENGGPLGNLTAAQVAAALIPDIVTIDFSQPVQFPNGRRLEDDVIDVALGVVLNRGPASGVSDGINANDVTFPPTFPYLATDNLPPAPTGTH